MSRNYVNSKPKLQSAIEYLITYGWGILIVIIALAALYSFIISPSSLVPDFCNFKYGPTCNNAFLLTSNTATNFAIIATNSLSFPIKNPSITVQVTDIGATGTRNITLYCNPKYVQPGSVFICTQNISGSPTPTLNSFYSFPIWITLYDCGTAPAWFSARSCDGALKETYTGVMQAHARSGAISSQAVSITLTASPTSVPANNLNYSKLVVNLKFAGQSVKGATINFTSNSSSVTIFPNFQVTDSNGNAIAYVKTSTPQTIWVQAYFIGIASNKQIITFTP